MSAEMKCDGCGETAPMVHYPRGAPGWHKPEKWYQREDEDGIQDACSRECIDKIAAKTGKSCVIFPF